MNFTTWEPAYEAVLSAFGYDRAADERARDEAAALATPFDRGRLDPLCGGTVAVAGAAPRLTDPADLAVAREADAVAAASTAADRLRAAGLDVDLFVTDLDKNPGTAATLAGAGTPVATHVHGDNRPAVREWLPRLAADATLVTTQAAPRGPVENFGGFTDGDRAAFIADAVGAARLRFPGWQFDDPGVSPEKARKLAWAERLLAWLERRRGERFPVLDGRRDGIDLPWLDGG